jgi:hypothetical protein
MLDKRVQLIVDRQRAYTSAEVIEIGNRYGISWTLGTLKRLRLTHRMHGDLIPDTRIVPYPAPTRIPSNDEVGNRERVVYKEREVKIAISLWLRDGKPSRLAKCAKENAPTEVGAF